MIRFFSHVAPWIVVAYLGLVLAGVGLYRLNQRTVKQDAARRAAVANCLTNRPLVEKFSRHVQGVNEFTRVQVQNSVYALASTPRSDPQYAVRKANLTRLTVAQEKVEALPSIPVPSVAKCKSLTG